MAVAAGVVSSSGGMVTEATAPVLAALCFVSSSGGVVTEATEPVVVMLPGVSLALHQKSSTV